MATTLYLIETKAARTYVCPSCQRGIRRGEAHFRHDPYWAARVFRDHATTHWCRECILASAQTSKDPLTGRLKISVVRLSKAVKEGSLSIVPFAPVQVQLIAPGPSLVAQLMNEPSQIHSLTPAQFEALICDRLYAMGFEPKQVGATNQKDGGIDVLFWPRHPGAFPILGAAQIKHHRDGTTKEGPRTVRELAGAIAGHPVNVALLVTNTSFSPDAEWFAKKHARLLKLRDFQDVRRWLAGSFGDTIEWREVPEFIELCPGVTIKVR